MEEKIKTPCLEEAVSRIRNQYCRILLFGASNTEKFKVQTHWSDVLEVGLRCHFGRNFHIINSGVCGNNTREALARFERDVASFSPDIVIITFAGNDCNPNPEKFVSGEEFAGNLSKIVEKVRALGAIPILQTYYKNDASAMDPERAAGFRKYQEIIRETAAENKVLLVDQFRYFSLLPLHTLRYKLLHDPMHLNEYGNTLMGVILLHHFHCDPRNIPDNERLLPAMELYKKIAE